VQAYPLLPIVGAAGISATASPDGSGEPLPQTSIYESGWDADTYNIVQRAISSGQLTLSSETVGGNDSGWYTRWIYALDVGKMPPATFHWQGTAYTLPFGKFTIWDDAAGAAYGMHLKNPALVDIDPGYGKITIPQNVYWKPTGADVASNIVMAVGEKLLITIATGAISGVDVVGNYMDAFDFTDYGDIMVNNDPGIDFGSTDPFTADYGDAISNTNVDQSINDMLDNTDAPVFDPDVNNQGVMDELSNGTNVAGDSASTTDEPGAPSNNNGATPKGGGLNLPTRGNQPGSTVAAPMATPGNISQPSYLPTAPRLTQSYGQSQYAPNASGMFPIYNPSPNPGSPNFYGTSAQPNSVSQSKLAPQAAFLGMPANPMLIIGGAVLAAALLLR
jgi:hypothetical protein